MASSNPLEAILPNIFRSENRPAGHWGPARSLTVVQEQVLAIGFEVEPEPGETVDVLDGDGSHVR